MDLIKFVEQSLNEMHERLTKSLHGLSQEELIWRPAPHTNCIAEILWHVVRAEDRGMRPRIGLGPELWETQRWYQRFGYPEEQSRDTDYQIFRTLGLPAPRLEDLVAYMEAVHNDTIDKLHNLSPDDFDRFPDPTYPERSLGAYFRHMVIHKSNHHGQIDYIRGLIQPDWDLTPGTGIVQP